MEALKIILTKVQEGKLDVEEALVLIEVIGVNKENKSQDIILDPPATPATPTMPWPWPWSTPASPTSPYFKERTTPLPGWNEVTCGASGNVGINRSNTSITN